MNLESKDAAVRTLNHLLADETDTLVRNNFSGIDSPWWWERHTDGGISICQELDPDALAGEVAKAFGLEKAEARWIATRTLGLENFDPVILVYELAGDTPTEQVVQALTERSSTTAGIAEALYKRLAEAVLESATPRERE